MTNAIFKIPRPSNEPVADYKPGSKERELIKQELDRQYNMRIEIPVIIGGQEIKTGDMAKCVCPHEHAHVLADYHQAGEKEIHMAIEASLKAKEHWEKLHWADRAAIFLKAADLISSKYKYILNAATMLNQDKSVYQAEIDSACELTDFFRFNAYYMQQIYEEQPMLNSQGVWNRLEYRPLEGFVFAVTPFNFTAIAGNLPSSPALMGNTVVWKPASTSILSGYYLMQLFKEAGLPDGVINFIPGRGSKLGNIVLNHPKLGGIHFTGSTGVFHNMWKTIANNIANYKDYPRIVGETGGKDFVFLHKSANAKQAAVAMVRGSFEYQGQKCSAASRAYVPESLWPEVKKEMQLMLEDIKKHTGKPEDFKFFNALIDEASYDNTMKYINIVKESKDAEIVMGGNGDKSIGYFIEPTVILAKKPDFITMKEELFAPVLTVYVYNDAKFVETLELCDQTSPYALTGSIFATDRLAVDLAQHKLRNAAGNFYINDKPTGAVVGQQPFGGARASGTNDKAGSPYNLVRWVNLRTIKETFVPPEDYKYPFMSCSSCCEKQTALIK